MRKIYLLLAIVVISALSLCAQSDFDYYIDFDNSTQKALSGRIYFRYSDGVYVASPKKIDSSFKIYNLKYDFTKSGQDDYIFGAADGQSPITPDSEITLGNPGNEITIGDTGAIYDATFIFDPTAKTLKIEGGSTVATQRELELNIISSTATSPQTGEITFSVDYIKPATSASPSEYTVMATYTDKNGDSAMQQMTLSGQNLTGTFNFTDLKANDLNPVLLEVSARLYGQELTDTAIAPVVTPSIPLLIGEISGHQWQADYGVEGEQFSEIADGMTYYYSVSLTGTGKFNFATSLGSSATDWATVNHSLRYAPSEALVAAPEKTWMPYTTYPASDIATPFTSNSWYPANFVPGPYIVELDYSTHSIAVVKGSIPTGVTAPETDSTPSTTDVYSISGIMLRHNVAADNAVAGLPSGLYIVNGSKIAVK